MYPAQTSLIPTTVAIARFLETNGPSSFFRVYPYWYLGTTPLRFLTGPVVPLLITGIHKALPSVSLFSISIYLIWLSFFLGALGWGILAKQISKNKTLGIVVAILFLLLPWRHFASLALDEASFIISRNFLPYALVAVWELLKEKSRKNFFLATLTVSFLLLINTSILSILIVGMSALILVASFKKGKIKKISKYIKPLLIILVSSLVLVTFWYTLSYWITILTNPSIGGATGFKVIFRILDLLRASVPLVLALLTVYLSGKIKSRFAIFSLTWVFTFLFLTVFRFIGDPDFWQDWTSWFYELEIGIALLIGIFLTRRKYFVSLILFTLPFLLSFYIYGLLGRPKLLSPGLPKGVLSLEKLAEIAGEKNVFLSGSTVFWANALYDIYQVRGGRDQVAVHPTWDKAAYEFREGRSPELAEGWLRELDTSFVLVHGPASAEYYHDFRNIQKWDEIGKIIWVQEGDVIYSFKLTSLP